MENKSEIFNALVEALKLTSAWGTHIRSIKFDEHAEVVEINFDGKLIRQSVWGDSGLSFIRDVVKHLK